MFLSFFSGSVIRLNSNRLLSEFITFAQEGLSQTLSLLEIIRIFFTFKNYIPSKKNYFGIFDRLYF